MRYAASPYVDFEFARSFQGPQSLPVVLAVFDRKASIKQPEVTQGVQLPAASPNGPKPVNAIALGAERSGKSIESSCELSHRF